MNNEFLNKIYSSSELFLRSNSPDRIDLDRYLEESFYQPKTINDVYKSFAHSLQNYQSMPNIIKFESRIDKFNDILYSFCPREVLKNYELQSLYDVLYNEFKFNNYSKNNNVWVKYAKGLISAAKFVSVFESFEEFDEFVESFGYNQFSIASLPMLIEKEVFGIGFALACDCLKELGYLNYPKPDIHLNEIFKALGLSDGSNFDTYKSIIKMSSVVGETPYKVDKVFWLVSSGKFYHDNVHIKGKKKELIEYLRKVVVKEVRL